MPTLFVTGTDTDCGKTHVSVALLHALAARGKPAVGYKPVAAGCERHPTGLSNADARALWAASAPGFDYADINPVTLEPPVAPHVAADDLGLTIDPVALIEGAVALQSRSEWVVVEGAGGFRVPLNAQQDFADMVEAAAWPVLLVVGMRLGCINHALLSVEAIQRRAPLLGWVANVLPPEQPRLGENIAALQARIPAPCLGIVRAATPQQAADEIDVEQLESILRKTP